MSSSGKSLAKPITAEEIARLRRLCDKATAAERGELLEYCAAHDYGDPGYPPSECPSCKFERDAALSELANVARTALPALLDEVERLREALDFYADPRCWEPMIERSEFGPTPIAPSRAEHDGGATARAALGVK